MTADELREKLPNEKACRHFLERMIWKNGRVCPHCGCMESWAIKGHSRVPAAVHCDHEDAIAQHEAPAVDLDPRHVLYGAFQQGRFFRLHRQVARHFPEDGLEALPFDPRDDGYEP